MSEKKKKPAIQLHSQTWKKKGKKDIHKYKERYLTVLCGLQNQVKLEIGENYLGWSDWLWTRQGTVKPSPTLLNNNNNKEKERTPMYISKPQHIKLP
ncbi:hypothetical protein STEG23_032222 [Scotinomys teguina]